jgi:hypothetical protein
MGLTDDKAYAVEQRLNALINGQTRLVLNQNQTVSSSADTPIAGSLGSFSIPVLNGQTWVVTAVVPYIEVAAAGVPRLSLHGPTIDTTKSMNVPDFQSTAAAAVPIMGFGTGYTQMQGPTMNGTRTVIVYIWASLVFTASGTLSLQASTSVNADNFTIQAGSRIEFVQAALI